MFVQIFSESLNCFATGRFCCGDAAVWARLSLKKIGLLSSRSGSQIWTAYPFATKLGLMVHHHKVDCLVKIGFLLWSRSQKGQNSSECSSGQYLLSCWTICNQLGMVMQHHGPKCHARRLVCFLQVQSQGRPIWSNVTVSTISAKLLIFLQSNLIGWFIIISWSALCKNCFLGQDHCKGSKLCWIFMYLISSVPLISWQPKVCLFTIIITKPSTTKWAYTDRSTLTCTITRHTMGGGGGPKTTNLVEM